MPLVVVLSSYVAGSRVGGGIAPYVLGPHKIDAVHVPTTLFGRHPGWGAPGGGAVPDEQFQGMIDGIAANGLLAKADVILTGYFTSSAQVEIAARAIDLARGTDGDRINGGLRIVVDPIIGDDSGAYVRADVGDAIKRYLLPRADILTPNAWELERLSGIPRGSGSLADAVAELPLRPSSTTVVTSVRAHGLIGAALVGPGENAHDFFGVEPINVPIPKGSGDLFSLLLIAALSLDHSMADSVSKSVATTDRVLSNAVKWDASELPLAACWGEIQSFAGTCTSVRLN